MLASGDYESGARFADFLDTLPVGVKLTTGAYLSFDPNWGTADADLQDREVEIAGHELRVSNGIPDDTLDRAAKSYAQGLRQALHTKRQAFLLSAVAVWILPSFDKPTTRTQSRPRSVLPLEEARSSSTETYRKPTLHFLARFRRTAPTNRLQKFIWRAGS